MQVTETNTDGLKRTLKVVVGAAELGERFTERLGEIKDRVQIKGFRKGKVPEAHIRKIYGRSLMSEVLEQTIRETSSKAIAERKERPAAMPDIALSEDKDEIERVIDGKADLAYSMSFEVIPDIAVMDLKSLKLERLVADADATAVDEAVGRLLERNVRFEAEEGRAAADGDRVTIDFVGTIDGVPFDGGKGEGLSLVLGQANFIPGFESGLMGVKSGEARAIDATFPADYPVEALAGKAARFDVKVTAVEKPVRPELDDAFAAGLGAESLDKLKALIGQQIKAEYDTLARMKLKRELLDEIDKGHDFVLPPTLVEREFEAIWRQLNESLKRSGKTLADEGKSEDEAREEYRKIAARRVRLGLVIGEIGDKHKVDVTQDELRRALISEARRYPGQEKFVYEYYEKTPGALAQLRAPIFEDKVVDLILEQVRPSEKKVSREELMEQVKEISEG